MKLRRRPRPRPRINLSPLIDVIFILLIFVVLAAKFSEQERLDVDLPSAAAGRPAEVDALYVEVSGNGAVWLMGQPSTAETLLDDLREARRRYHRLLLVADKDIVLQSAVDVISAAKLAGFETVAVATRAPEATP